MISPCSHHQCLSLICSKVKDSIFSCGFWIWCLWALGFVLEFLDVKVFSLSPSLSLLILEILMLSCIYAALFCMLQCSHVLEFLDCGIEIWWGFQWVWICCFNFLKFLASILLVNAKLGLISWIFLSAIVCLSVCFCGCFWNWVYFFLNFEV